MDLSMSYFRFLAADESPSADFTNPAVWVNLGVAGVFLAAFFAGKLHSNKEMGRVEALNKSALDAQLTASKLAYEAQQRAQDSALQRLDDQVRQLLVERDRALAERDEMIGVMKDFTMMAGAVLNQEQPWRKPKAQPPRRGGE